MGDAGSREEPLGPSVWLGSRPFTAATQVSEFEGEVSWQLPSWSLGLRIDHLLEVFTQKAPWERGGVWHLSVAFLTAAYEFTVISKSKVEKRYQTLGLELEFQLYFNSDHNY